MRDTIEHYVFVGKKLLTKMQEDVDKFDNIWRSATDRSEPGTDKHEKMLTKLRSLETRMKSLADFHKSAGNNETEVALRKLADDISAIINESESTT